MLNGFCNIDDNSFDLYKLECNLIDDYRWVCAVHFAVVYNINITGFSCLSSSKNMGVFWVFKEIVCKLPSKQRIVGCLEVKVYDGEVGLLR